MHKTAPVLEAGFGVPFLHIADIAAQAATALGVTRVGLTGVGVTMAEPFYAARLGTHGLDVLVPGQVDRQRLDAAVFDELCRGVLSDSTRTALRGVLARLVEQGAEAVVLGCTELDCCSVRTTAPCRCCPRPGSTSRPPWTPPSRDRSPLAGLLLTVHRGIEALGRAEVDGSTPCGASPRRP